MATQPTNTRAHAHRSMLVLAGFATVLTTIVVGWFLITLRPVVPTPTNQPLPAAVLPAPEVVIANPDIAAANRTFSDEIAGASAQDLSSAANGMQPEWAQPAAPEAAPAAMVVQQDISAANRTFSDEIAGAGAQDLSSAANGMQPEWMTAVEQAASKVINAVRTVFGDNRIFADEINAGPGSIDWNAPQPEAPIVAPNGNR